MVSKETSQSGNVNISGSLNQHGDIVGRDKIIHNIIVVGRVLDFAQVDGLIPQLSDMPKLENISAAFEPNFKERLGSDLSNAIAIAGQILEPILSSWTPQSGRALIFRDILLNLATPLGRKIQELNYWDVFCEPMGVLINQKRWNSLLLSSLSGLWNKYKTDKITYNLATLNNEAFVFIATHQTTGFTSQEDFKEFKREEFRIFIVGIVLDLIRMASLVSNDIDFWNQVIDSLSNNS
jgi:hypothetical protein